MTTQQMTAEIRGQSCDHGVTTRCDHDPDHGGGRLISTGLSTRQNGWSKVVTTKSDRPWSLPSL